MAQAPCSPETGPGEGLERGRGESRRRWAHGQPGSSAGPGAPSTVEDGSRCAWWGGGGTRLCHHRAAHLRACTVDRLPQAAGLGKERGSSRRRGPGRPSPAVTVRRPGPPRGPPGRLAHPFLPPPKLEKRSVFADRAGQYADSDEEDGYESPDAKRRGASVDDFLKGSELGKPVSGAGLTASHGPLEVQRPQVVTKTGRGQATGRRSQPGKFRLNRAGAFVTSFGDSSKSVV